MTNKQLTFSAVLNRRQEARLIRIIGVFRQPGLLQRGFSNCYRRQDLCVGMKSPWHKIQTATEIGHVDISPSFGNRPHSKQLDLEIGDLESLLSSAENNHKVA